MSVSRVSAGTVLAALLLSLILAGPLSAQSGESIQTNPLPPPSGIPAAEEPPPANPPAANPPAEDTGLPASLLPEGTAAIPDSERGAGAARTLPSAGEGAGLLGDNDGGFGWTMWAGTDRRAIEALLSRLPVATGSPALYELARRLLLTNAPLPQSLVAGPPAGGTDLLTVRLERLAALGDLDGLSRMLQRLPGDRTGSLKARLEAELALTEGDTKAACALAKTVDPSTAAGTFWQKALIYCLLQADDRPGAELGLSLLREVAGPEDRTFVRLAEAVLGLRSFGAAEATKLDGTRIAPLDVALLSQLAVPLPPSFVEKATPRARLQLVHNQHFTLPERAAAAEWAVNSRRLQPAILSQLYAAFAFTPEQLDDAIGIGYGLPGIQARALYFQVLRERDLPQLSLEIAEQALARAEADGVFQATASVVLTELEMEPSDTAYAGFADTAGRALFSLGRYEEATAWQLLARQESVISAQAAVAAHRLWPYSRLAGVVEFGNEAGLEGWRSTQPDPYGADVAQRLGLLRVLFQALGESDAMSWIDLATSEQDKARPLPDASLLYALDDASLSGRLGETVLLALIVMGDRPPAEAHPLALNAVLTALLRVGLPLEARSLAIEAALGNGI